MEGLVRLTIRSRLEPIKRVVRLIEYDWNDVINAATTNVINARSEGLNSKIQWIKRKACGYRNRKRFHNAVYFYLADLALYPDSLQSTHTKARSTSKTSCVFRTNRYSAFC